MHSTRLFLAIALSLVTSGLQSRRVLADDWTRFRGPNGAGISADAKPVPSQWSSEKNLRWKVELPGAGVSSPIVVADRVFVTCYSGYGLDRGNPGDIKNLKRHLVCVNALTGDMLWTKSVDAVLPEDPYSGIGVTAHGYASHTPVSDGENVYVFFGKSGVIAFDFEGNQLWKTSVGTGSDPREWGSSSSPILYKNLLIVTAAAESESLVALDTKTGKQVWREEASGFANMWGTPILVESKDRTELVMSVAFDLWSFDPETGKFLWYCEASDADQAQASAITSDGVVYAVSGRGGGSIAVRAGGKDDVTGSQVVWKTQDSGSFGSPLLYDGKFYVVASDRISGIDAKTGKRVVQARLGASGAQEPSEEGGRGGRGGRGGFGASDYASPVIADGKLYYLKGTGEVYVFKLGEELEQIAVNKVTEDRESFGGTPAISDGRLFLRSDKHLYCVGQ